MAINIIPTPAKNPASVADYVNQNRILKNLMYFSNIHGEFFDDICTIKRGSIFEYKGDMYVVDSDILLYLNSENKKSDAVFHLVFNGKQLRLHTTHPAPAGSFNPVLNGYYEDDPEDYTAQIKYLGYAVIRSSVPDKKKSRINGFLTVRKAHLREIYIRFPASLHPRIFYWGQWENISRVHAGAFFRVEGQNTESNPGSVYGSDVQEQSLKRHTHDIGYYSAETEVATRVNFAQNSQPTGFFSHSDSANRNTSTTQTTNSDFDNLRLETRPLNHTIQIYRCINEVN